MEVITEWIEILKVFKEKHCQPQIPFSAKATFRNESKIRIFFLDKQHLRKIVSIYSTINAKGSSSGRKNDKIKGTLVSTYKIILIFKMK